MVQEVRVQSAINIAENCLTVAIDIDDRIVMAGASWKRNGCGMTRIKCYGRRPACWLTINRRAVCASVHRVSD